MVVPPARGPAPAAHTRGSGSNWPAQPQNPPAGSRNVSQRFGSDGRSFTGRFAQGMNELLNRFAADPGIAELVPDCATVLRSDIELMWRWRMFHLALLRLPATLSQAWRAEAQSYLGQSRSGVVEIPALVDKQASLLIPAVTADEDEIHASAGGLISEEVALHLNINQRDHTAHCGVGVPVTCALTVAAFDSTLTYVADRDEVRLSEPDGYALVCADVNAKLGVLKQNLAPEEYLAAMIDVDAVLRCLVHHPASAPDSWWAQAVQRSRRCVDAAARHAREHGHDVIVEELTGMYADLRRQGRVHGAHRDLPSRGPANLPGKVLACLRLYAEVDGEVKPGRVMYGGRG